MKLSSTALHLKLCPSFDDGNDVFHFYLIYKLKLSDLYVITNLKDEIPCFEKDRVVSFCRATVTGKYSLPVPVWVNFSVSVNTKMKKVLTSAKLIACSIFCYGKCSYWHR